MAKAFFDVFPALKLDGKRRDLFAQTQVDRVTATRMKDFVRVYLSSDRLIQKNDILAVEKEIKKQLFSGCHITVKIQEKFRLSSQYDQETLLETYRDSILLELSQYSHLLYSMFKNAQITFHEQNRMELLIEDTVLSRSRSGELGEILEKIFHERCGLPVIVCFAYREARTGRFKEEDDIFISRRVAEIASRYHRARGDGEAAAYAQAQAAGYGTAGSRAASGRMEGAETEAGGRPARTGAAGQGGAASGYGAAPGAAGQESAGFGYAAAGEGAGAGKPYAGEGALGAKASAEAAPFEGGTVYAGGSPRTEGPARSGEKLTFAQKFASRKGGSFGKGKRRGRDDNDSYRSARRSDNPDVLYGRDFEEEAMPIEDIMGEMGEVIIRGKILSLDKREIKNERTILIFDVTDFTDTMTVKMFVRTEQVAEICEGVKSGVFVKLKGITMVDKFDGELTIGSVVGIKKISDFTHSRVDHSVRKRVELHCHTKMSDMDGVSEAKDIVKRAYQWGHPAIAITDHGVVQSFPDASHLVDDLWKAEKKKRQEAGDENPDRNDFFKVIYGMEAYLVDDLREIVTKIGRAHV